MVMFLQALVVVSLPTRGAWIEIVMIYFIRGDFRSLPTRGAWIEIHDG